MIDTYVDWKIHRKLDEARTIYIYPARGSGRTQPLYELVDDLLESGKKVHVVTAADLPKRSVDIKQIKETILDLDLHGTQSWWKGRDDRLWEELKLHFHQAEPSDRTGHTMICTSNPYGRPWII